MASESQPNPGSGRKIELPAGVSEYEAAAMIAAIEQFLAETSAPAGGDGSEQIGGWERAARHEGVKESSSAWWSPWGSRRGW